MEAKICSLLDHRRIYKRWIVHRKILYKYCAESEAKIWSLLIYRWTEDKWTYHSKILCKYSAEFETKIWSSWRDRPKHKRKMIRTKVQLECFCGNGQKDLPFTMESTNTRQMNNSYHDSIEILRSIRSKDSGLIIESTNTRQMSNSYQDSFEIFCLTRREEVHLMIESKNSWETDNS